MGHRGRRDEMREGAEEEEERDVGDDETGEMEENEYSQRVKMMLEEV